MSVRLNALRDALSADGDLQSALAAYREALDIRRALAATDPRQHPMARGCVNLVLILMSAVATGRGGLSAPNAFDSTKTGSPRPHADKSRRLLAIGDARKAEGDFAGALASCREAVRIRRALAATDPCRGSWQGDLR
jgi:tetratricopeptide (TPR) repeat protein